MLTNVVIAIVLMVFFGATAYHTYLFKSDVLWYPKYVKEREYSEWLNTKKNEIEKEYNELKKEYEKLKNSAEN